MKPSRSEGLVVSRLFLVLAAVAHALAIQAEPGRLLWTFPSESEGRLPQRPYVSTAPPEMVVDSQGRVFLNADDSMVYCLETATGHLLWGKPGGRDDGWGVSRLVALESGKLLAGRYQQGSPIHGMDSSTGNLLWTAPGCWFPVVESENTALAVGKNEIHRVRLDTGKTARIAEWTPSSPGRAWLTMGGDGKLIVLQGGGINNSDVGVIAPRGGFPRWRYFGSGMNTVTPGPRGCVLVGTYSGGAPVSAGQILYFGAGNSRPAGIRTKEHPWPTGSFAAPMRWDGSDYFWIIDRDQFRRARFLDRIIDSTVLPLTSNGSPAGLLNQESATILADGTLLIIAGFSLLAVDAETGAFLWERPLLFRGFPVLGQSCNVSADGTVLISGYVLKDPGYVPQEIVLMALEGSAPLAPGWARSGGSPGQSGGPHSGPPRLVRPARDVIVQPGSVAHLSPWITGFPEPTFRWFRNQALLEGESTFRLERSDVGARDEGSYLVEARNSLGVVTTGQFSLSISHTNVVQVPHLQFVETLPSELIVGVESASKLSGPWKPAGPFRRHQNGFVDMNPISETTRFYRQSLATGPKLTDVQFVSALVVDAIPGTRVEIQRAVLDPVRGDYWVPVGEVVTDAQPYLWLPPQSNVALRVLYRVRKVSTAE